MKKSMQILSALLVLQIGLAAFLLSRKEVTASFEATEPLLTLDKDQLDKIVIEEKEGETLKSLELVKKEGHWLLPARFDFPILESKMQEFLTTLGGFKKSWPVGHTDIAAKQFKVVDESFERRLSFFHGDKKLHTLYLGSSPSFKKVHVRVDADKQTYGMPFSAYEASTAYKDWLDKKYLDVDRAKVKGITLGDISLHNESGDFLLQGLSDTQETNKAKVSALVSKVLSLPFEDVLGAKDSVARGPEVFEYRLTGEGDEQLVYSFYQDPNQPQPAAPSESGKQAPPADEKLILVSSKHPFAFQVQKSRVESLLNAKREELAKVKGEESKEGAGEGTSEGDKDKLPLEGQTGALQLEEEQGPYAASAEDEDDAL